MTELLKSFWTDESGQTLAEYALLLGLIAIVCIVVLTTLGTRIEAVFQAITTELESVPAT